MTKDEAVEVGCVRGCWCYLIIRGVAKGGEGGRRPSHRRVVTGIFGSDLQLQRR